MDRRIFAFSAPADATRKIIATHSEYNALTDTRTPLSSYFRLAVEDRLRRDAERIREQRELALEESERSAER